ncbi:MAG: NADH-quinone oxidoreductase subunit N, partial [Methylobacteriaceae bacterium]|nr:NADH-quinone oxidoreductase subunit N [Methylobacteriaceae bacterium]
MATTFAASGFGSALPEIIVALGTLALVLVGAFRGERSTVLVGTGAFAILLAAFVALVVLPSTGRETVLGGSFIADGFAKYMKALVLLGSAATLALSSDYMARERFIRFEYPILILLSTIGMMMMVSANDLISLYLGLELQSLAAYVIAAIHRDDARSSEAGLKYFVLGALSSGMLLYGASLVYGFAGSVSFPAIAAAVSGEAPIGLIVGIVFLAAGVAFKMSAAPFHMWTPDVYEGAPTPVTAFLASAPKIAAVAMSVRVFVGAFPEVVASWQQIIIFVSVLSMALGS